jgi:hypothetical protein
METTSGGGGGGGGDGNSKHVELLEETYAVRM